MGLQHKKLLEAISDPPDDEGMSAPELAAAAGVSLRTLQIRLQRLQAEGRVVVGTRRVRDALGRSSRIPVYRIKEES